MITVFIYLEYCSLRAQIYIIYPFITIFHYFKISTVLPRVDLHATLAYISVYICVCVNECMHGCFNSIAWARNQRVSAYWISYNKVSNRMFSVYRSEIFCVSVPITPFVRAMYMTLGAHPPHSCRDAGGRYAQRSRSIDRRWWALIEFVGDQRIGSSRRLRVVDIEPMSIFGCIEIVRGRGKWDYITCVQGAYLTRTTYTKTSSYYLK